MKHSAVELKFLMGREVRRDLVKVTPVLRRLSSSSIAES